MNNTPNEELLQRLLKKVINRNVKKLSPEMMVLVNQSTQEILYYKSVDVLVKYGLLNWPLTQHEHDLVISRTNCHHLDVVVYINWKPTGDVNDLWDNFTFLQRIHHYINNINDIPICHVCQTNKCNIRSNKPNEYTLHCSYKCRALDPEVESKRVSSCVERYGHDCSLSDDAHISQTRQTCLKNNGVMYPLQNKDILQKTADTVVELYGNKDETRDNILKRFVSQSFEKKYGVSTLGQVAQLPQHRENWLKSHQHHKTEVWLPTRLDSFKDVCTPLFAIDQFDNRFQILPYKCTKCENVFEDHIGDGKIPRCPTCYPLNSTNWQQQELIDFCASQYSEVVVNNRSIISPLELDVFIKSINLALEYNGIYWHSDAGSRFRVDNNYHLNKTNMCQQQGIQLIHIFSDEWCDKKEIVKSIISSKMGRVKNKIFARKLKIIQVNSQNSRDFLNDNHIQGRDLSTIRLALIDDNDGIQCMMTFCLSRYNKNYQWELSRFCNKLDTQVVGGASKLLNYFIKNFDPKSIITYADRRFSTGQLYKTLNFVLDGVTDPNFFYVNINEGCDKRYSRLKFQKHKLPDLLDNYDDNLTAQQNMENNKYARIWDCGSYRFVMNLQ